MKMIQILNYDDKYEHIRADQIESVVAPGRSPHDAGAVVLLGGRRIALSSHSYDQHIRIVREMREE